MVAGVAAAMLPLPAFAAAASGRPNGSLVAVEGSRLWVEQYGRVSAPALLYIHGGPGLGVFEFSHYMRDLLAGSLRLVLVDQRGVLRSDPLRPGEAVTYQRLAADFEQVRNRLGIRRWAVIGHSWGGPIALHYANAHPRAVSHVIFENPVLDPASTGRNMLGWAAVALETAGKKAEAARLRAVAGRPTAEMWNAMDAALGTLPARQALYVHDPAFLGYYGRITADAGIPDSRWEQGQAMARSLLAQPSTFAPAQDALAALRQPTLLVRGQFDPATSPDEVAALTAKRSVHTVSVPDCSHFVHVEKPQVLATEIMRFLHEAPSGARAS